MLALCLKFVSNHKACPERQVPVDAERTHKDSDKKERRRWSHVKKYIYRYKNTDVRH